MGQMNIAITKKEYRDLLDLLQMAHLVIHAHKTEEDPRIEKYEAIMQKILAASVDAGLGNLVEYSADMKAYQPTTEFEDTSEAPDFIDEFADDTFWDLLVRRLTDRDLARTVGEHGQADELSMTERFTLEAPLIKKYSDEIDEHGIERLEIVDQRSALVMPVKTSD
jgi:hypothetical protein